MRQWRIILAVAGISLILFGAVRVLVGVPIGQLIVLAAWFIGAVIIHDGVVAPATVAGGWLMARTVPPRARRYLQGFLITGGLVTVFAIPLILRRNTQPASKAILQQNYGGHLTILLGVIAAVSLILYAIHVAHDAQRRRPGNAEARPSKTGPGPATEESGH